VIQTDVVIVGAGPAGSTCAWALVREGLEVLVLDRAQFPRDKVCAGWITPAVLSTLEITPQTYARNCVLQPITGFRTALIEGPVIENHYGETVSYGIRRFEFDHYLLQRSGAKQMLGSAVESIEDKNGYWLINGEIKTPLLIGAGGHACPVARHLGASLGHSVPVVTAREAELVLESAVDGKVPELYFCRDLKGYGWCFRKGEYLNIGMGRENGSGLKQHLGDFVDHLVRERRIAAPPRHFKGHAYLLYGRGHRRSVDEGIMLVGDALGLAYPRSGEGIRPAVESALMAAQTVIEAKGDYRAAKLQAYEQRLLARFGNPSGRDLLPPLLLKPLATALFRSRALTRRLLIERWFLHRDQAPLTAV